MDCDRRNFVKNLLMAGAVSEALALGGDARSNLRKRTIPVTLVQFDSVPEQVERNVAEVERLAERAVGDGARWVIFHEGTLCDYTPRLAELAEPVPSGRSTQRLQKLAHRLGCYLSFGLSEVDRGRYYITQVFLEPGGFVYRYRKTWIFKDATDRGYRNEWARYDPGAGPDLFEFDGVKSTCFICADGTAPRCIQRAADLHPEVVFFPNNHSAPCSPEQEGERARAIRAPILVPNRVGYSWMHKMMGGSLICSADGEVLAAANREGKEELLHHNLIV